MKISIRIWITLLINLLIAATVIVLSIFFYREFQKTLDDRVLMQLTSIKRLKRLQIEEYLKQSWKNFDFAIDSTGHLIHPDLIDTSQLYYSEQDAPEFIKKFLEEERENGIYDISTENKKGRMLLLLVKRIPNNHYVLLSDNAQKIQQILLVRTGMGKSGETYLVGPDFKLRSESRFFPNTPPLKLSANTIGVTRAFNEDYGTSIITDYRGEAVYSSFHLLTFDHIRWSILSEMDVKEVTIPLIDMKKQLLYIGLLVMLGCGFISFLLTSVLSKPIVAMSRVLKSMSRGNYTTSSKQNSISKEMSDMFNSLNSLQHSLSGAVRFSEDLGEMHLDANYDLISENDLLGKSLIQMRNKLKEFNLAKEKHQIDVKNSLIIGEENERKRISKELHDGLGPLLTTLKLQIQESDISNERKKQIKLLLDEIITEVRRMTYNIMPQALIDFGVGKALHQFVDLLNTSTSGISIEYINSMKDSHSNTTKDIDICLFRVAQEILNNGIKHAHASKIILSLTEFDDRVSLFYKDNGAGFNPKKSYSGSGLKNIQGRIEVFKGYLSIQSSDQGTEIEVEIPIKS